MTPPAQPSRGDRWGPLVEELRRLRVQAGNPPLRELAARAGPRGPAVSTISETLNGKRDRVSWEFVRGFAYACAEAARERQRSVAADAFKRLRETWDSAASGAAVEPEAAGPAVAGVLASGMNLLPRNPGFVGRQADLDALDRAFQDSGVVALTGPGGVGKSQLALEYAHRQADRYRVVWWCDAEEPHLLAEAYADLAVQLSLAGPTVEVPLAGRLALRQLAGTADWLIVLDNAGDPEALRRYWPRGRGRTLVTSRDPAWAWTAVRCQLGPVTRSEAVAMICSLHPGLDDEAADRLAAELGDLPLGLAQAGRYLAETGTSAERLLTRLREQPGDALDVGRPIGYPRSLARTVRDAVRGAEETAPRWPQLISLLAPEPVPARLVEQLHHEPGTEDPVAVLVRFGLVTPGPSGIRMHRLTRAIIADDLDPATRLRDRIGQALLAAVPGDPDDPDGWPLWSPLIPHVLAAAPATNPDVSTARAALRLIEYFLARAELESAEHLSSSLIAHWPETFGAEHDVTRRATQLHAWVLRASGRAAEALELNSELHRTLLGTHGPDHPDTLWAAHDLAWSLRSLGHLDQARSIGEDTLTRRRTVIGPDHLLTLGTATNLANVYFAMGLAEPARALARETLDRLRATVGPRHHFTLMVALNLASFDAACGDAAEALIAIEENVTVRSQLYGDTHPGTLLAAVNLAEVLLQLESLPRARTVATQTAERSAALFGNEHPETLYARGLIASVLAAEGDRDGATRMRTELLEESARLLGPDHPDTQALRAELAGE